MHVTSKDSSTVYITTESSLIITPLQSRILFNISIFKKEDNEGNIVLTKINKDEALKVGESIMIQLV